MPRVTTTTCDLCGAPAETYPAFFDLLSDGPSYQNVAGDPAGVVRTVPPNPHVSTRGCLRPGLFLCLCREHFDSLVTAAEEWLEKELAD